MTFHDVTAPPVSVSTVAFDGHPLAVAFAAIARAGARAVEPAYIDGYVDFDEDAFGDGNAAAVAAGMAAEGLSSAAVSAHIDMGLPDAADRLRRRLRFARRIGAGILITNTTTRDRADALRHTLDAVLPLCAELGVVLALENPGQGADLVVGRGAEGAALVGPYDSPWLRLNYDFGNVLTYSRERVRPEADMAAALPFMAHAHVKDVLSTPEGWRFTAIGRGSIDYPAVTRVLARTRPDLPVGLELPLRLDRPGRGDPVRSKDKLALDAIETAVRASLRFWADTTRAASAA